MITTPIAVFTYNRPVHTRQLLESLAACSRLDECRVIFFSDGPKTPEQEQSVLATRAILHNEWKKRLHAQVIEQAVNRGLARSIVDGVTNLCEEFGRVIVLEDDMIVNPRFLDYMISALDRYEDDERVCQISGYMFPIEHKPYPDAFFLPLTTTRGWAIWKRAWQLFQWDVSGALTGLQEQTVRHAFDLDGAYPYSKMLEDCIAGRNDSWGIRWWWSVFRLGKVTLHPRHSLVWVGGFDGTGTHSGINESMMTLSQSDTVDFPWGEHFAFPSEVEINRLAMKRINDYLHKNFWPAKMPKPFYKRLKIRFANFLKAHLK